MEPLSILGKRWKLLSPSPLPASEGIVDVLARERGISREVVGHRKLSDPFLFPQMEKAVQRIEQAVIRRETIGLFGDYDADGITGVAQLVHALRRRGSEPVVYLPDRAREGYGLKAASAEALREKGVTLLITVDTGISAGDVVASLQASGVDVIVTDHHRLSGSVPPAFAILHPTVPTNFPCTHLSGSGVAFMLVRALERGKIWEGIDRDIALACIGTVGDVVPLVGDNRLLVQQGLSCIESLPSSPLKELIDAACPNGKVSSTDIAFRIVPRINAAGRMAHPSIALDALLVGGSAIDRLHELNSDRQSLVIKLLTDARRSLDTTEPFLVSLSERFTHGTVGLLAGKLTEAHGKPSIVGVVHNGTVTASLRSIDGIDLMSCLTHSAVRPHLVSFGGHAQAAGCTFAAERAADLRRGLQSALTFLYPQAELLPTLTVDMDLTGNISTAFARSLDVLAPFGAGNKEPRFLLRSRQLQQMKTVGSDGSHLQCLVDDVRGVGFGLGEHAEAMSRWESADLVCRVGINSWNNRTEAQVFIEDARSATPA